VPPPWSPEETADAAYATRAGLDELSTYFFKRPRSLSLFGRRRGAVHRCLLFRREYAGPSERRSRARAWHSDDADGALFLGACTVRATCREFLPRLSLTIYAHQLLPAEDPRTPVMVAPTNAAFRACGSLAEAMGYDYRQRLAVSPVSVDDVWDLVMWSVTLTAAQLVPGLALPPEARDLRQC